MDVRAVTGVIGAEVRGVDLRDVGPTEVAALRAALLEHLVLFFPDQELDDESHLRLAEQFGEVMVPLIDAASSEVRGVTVLDQVAPVGRGTDRWHCDSTFAECPPLGSILRAVELPEVGGDTLFASMYAAYETLSEPIRTMLDGLHAVHSTAIVNELMRGLDVVHREGADQSFVHPVVRVHPETGRTLLFVNGNFTTRIVELSLDESDALLGMLFAHVKSPTLQCRFHWTPGAVAFWDNRAVQHFASPDYMQRRVMHRVMIAGDRPVGPS
jgi:taurine dioxygenase